MTQRPVLLVLAGVNGAGKSSLLGRSLEARSGLSWFDPDDFARALVRESGLSRADADAAAWAEGLRRLDAAIDGHEAHALETTLGGRTFPGRIRAACATHDVHLLYCGLASVELHIERVRRRVERGGHDIPEARIRERFASAPRNLIGLMPQLAGLQVFDNSDTARDGEAIRTPRLVLRVARRRVLSPDPQDAAALSAVPAWARPVVEAAFAVDDADAP